MEDKYYVTEFPDDMDREHRNQFINPFNENGAPEIEKIVDALVGNLKDYVQVEERPEGGQNLLGKLVGNASASGHQCRLFLWYQADDSRPKPHGKIFEAGGNGK